MAAAQASDTRFSFGTNWCFLGGIPDSGIVRLEAVFHSLKAFRSDLPVPPAVVYLSEIVRANGRRI